MADLFPISWRDMIAELDREIDTRRRVYPRWISDGRISQEDADRRVAILKRIRDVLSTPGAEDAFTR